MATHFSDFCARLCTPPAGVVVTLSNIQQIVIIISTTCLMFFN